MKKQIILCILWCICLFAQAEKHYTVIVSLDGFRWDYPQMYETPFFDQMAREGVNNFVRTMLKLGNEKDEISVVADQHGSPTYAEDLANIIAEAIEKKIQYGLYHSTNQGFTTWYDFTKKIFELADIKCNVKPVTSEEFIRPAKRPKNSKLNKQKLLDQGVTVPEWEDGLKRYLEIELH